MKHLIASLIISVSILLTLNATSHSEAFSIGDLQILSNERGFQEINLSDYGKTGIIGNSELPQKVVNFIIPKNQDASNLQFRFWCTFKFRRHSKREKKFFVASQYILTPLFQVLFIQFVKGFLQIRSTKIVNSDTITANSLERVLPFRI